MSSGKYSFLKVVLFVIALLTLFASIVWLPSLARQTISLYPEFASLRIPLLVGLYITVIPFFFALYQALILLRLIEQKEAFSPLAVNALRHIRNAAIVICSLYFASSILLVTNDAMYPAVMIIIGLTMFTSVTIFFFAAVLQELLRNALKIKTENDLTV